MQSAKWQKYCKLMDAREGRSASIEYKWWKSAEKVCTCIGKKQEILEKNTQSYYIEKKKNQF